METPQTESAPATLEGVIELKLEGEWKTYWRSPGDAGFPMTIDLGAAASNIASVTIHWPYPTRFVEEWGLEVFGYKHDVQLPVTVTLIDPGQPTQADLRISYAVCSDICINEEHHVSLEIPAGYQSNAKTLQKIAAARAAVPLQNGAGGLTIGKAAILSEDTAQNKGVLSVQAVVAEGRFNKPDLFIEGPVGIRFPRPDVKVEGKGKQVEFRIPYELSLPAKTLDGAELTLTLVNGAKSVEVKLAVEKAASPHAAFVPQEEKPNGWWERFASAEWFASASQ